MGYCLTKAKLSQGFSVAKHHCLANNNSQINLFVWDPTEPVATRPLFTTGSGNRKFFYTCDGNKNVSEFVHFETRNGIAAHYDYAPFGAVTRAISASAITDNTFTTDNPFRFSSEYHDDTLGLVYYNYRHYNPIDGRWCGRDPIESCLNLQLYCNNFAIVKYDVLGLKVRCCGGEKYETKEQCCVENKVFKRKDECLVVIYYGHFGGNKIEEITPRSNDTLELKKKEQDKKKIHQENIYVTCYAKSMNENREKEGEYIVPAPPRQREEIVIYPYPKEGILPKQHVDVIIKLEVKNAAYRVAALSMAKCCKSYQLKFEELPPRDQSDSVKRWSNDANKRILRQTLKQEFSEEVQKAKNELKKRGN